MTDQLAHIRGLLSAIEEAQDPRAFYAPDFVQREWPNAMFPQGATRDLAAALEAFQRGTEVISLQHFEIIRSISEGESVAVEADWFGTLAMAAGDFPAGHVLRARLAMFFRFRDGKIFEQENFDAYLP